jgi:gas vesicle protein
MSFLDKAKSMLSKNSDKAKGAVDKAGDVFDQKTGGKHAQTVDSVQEKAKDLIDENKDGGKDPA